MGEPVNAARSHVVDAQAMVAAVVIVDCVIAKRVEFGQDAGELWRAREQLLKVARAQVAAGHAIVSEHES